MTDPYLRHAYGDADREYGYRHDYVEAPPVYGHAMAEGRGWRPSPVGIGSGVPSRRETHAIGGLSREQVMAIKAKEAEGGGGGVGRVGSVPTPKLGGSNISSAPKVSPSVTPKAPQAPKVRKVFGREVSTATPQEKQAAKWSKGKEHAKAHWDSQKKRTAWANANGTQSSLNTGCVTQKGPLKDRPPKAPSVTSTPKSSSGGQRASMDVLKPSEPTATKLSAPSAKSFSLPQSPATKPAPFKEPKGPSVTSSPKAGKVERASASVFSTPKSEAVPRMKAPKEGSFAAGRVKVAPATAPKLLSESQKKEAHVQMGKAIGPKGATGVGKAPKVERANANVLGSSRGAKTPSLKAPDAGKFGAPKEKPPKEVKTKLSARGGAGHAPHSPLQGITHLVRAAKGIAASGGKAASVTSEAAKAGGGALGRTTLAATGQNQSVEAVERHLHEPGSGNRRHRFGINHAYGTGPPVRHRLGHGLGPEAVNPLGK